MGQHAEDLQQQEGNPYHQELNPNGYKTRNTFTWTTRDGTKIRLPDMETSHIENCIKMLRSQIIDTWAVHGDEPKYGAGGYNDHVMHEHNERIEETIDIFKTELEFRKKKQ